MGRWRCQGKDARAPGLQVLASHRGACASQLNSAEVYPPCSLDLVKSNLLSSSLMNRRSCGPGLSLFCFVSFVDQVRRFSGCLQTFVALEMLWVFSLNPKP